MLISMYKNWYPHLLTAEPHRVVLFLLHQFVMEKLKTMDEII